MRVLIAHNFYRSHFIGGEDRVALSEEKYLKESLGQENVFTYYVYNDQIKPLPLLKNIWGDTHHANALQNIIQREKIQILHVHNEFPLLTPLIFHAAKQVNCKVVQTLHNFRQQCLSGILFKKNNICEKCIHKKLKLPGILNKCYRDSRIQSGIHACAQYWYNKKKYYDDVDRYFVLSEFQKNKLIQMGVPQDKLWLKPNCIPAPLNNKLPSIQSKKNKFCWVGRIEEAKGISWLCQKWLQLPDHFHLEIIGDGPDFTKLKNQFHSANIQFLGKCDHNAVLEKLKCAQYLIHSSFCYETFGLTLLEAMSLGVPVIGLNIGTRLEFISHQKNGFLCTKENFIDTLKLANDYSGYEELSKQAYLFAQKYYPDVIGRMHIQYYEKMLQEG